MPTTRIHKSNIAMQQLETAIWLFLNERDLSSVITLAGAASGILDRLVRDEGKETFVDYACRVHRELNGFTPKRRSYSHHIDKRLGISIHKHLSEGEPDIVKLDLDEMAFNAITRAVSDYIVLNGQSEPFIQAFLRWAWDNVDGEKQMEIFRGVPEKMKPK